MYQTKTGVALEFIIGGGETIGRSRAKLRIVVAGEMPQVEPYENDTLSVHVENCPYLGLSYPEVVATLRVDAKAVSKLGVDPECRKLVRWLESRFGISTRGGNYTIDKRAKRGTKRVTFRFEISSQDAKRLGFGGRYAEHLNLIQAG